MLALEEKMMMMITMMAELPHRLADLDDPWALSTPRQHPFTLAKILGTRAGSGAKPTCPVTCDDSASLDLGNMLPCIPVANF